MATKKLTKPKALVFKKRYFLEQYVLHDTYGYKFGVYLEYESGTIVTLWSVYKGHSQQEREAMRKRYGHSFTPMYNNIITLIDTLGFDQTKFTRQLKQLEKEYVIGLANLEEQQKKRDEQKAANLAAVKAERKLLREKQKELALKTKKPAKKTK